MDCRGESGLGYENSSLRRARITGHETIIYLPWGAEVIFGLGCHGTPDYGVYTRLH